MLTPFSHKGFPGGSDGKVSAHNVRDAGSIPGPGRSPGEGNGDPLQYSCLENSMDGGAWSATVHGVAKIQTRLSDFTLPHFVILMFYFIFIFILLFILFIVVKITFMVTF